MMDHAILPVLIPNVSQDVKSTDADGAYYLVRCDEAQIIIIGPMHFTPGQYLEALNELLEERFEHHYNAFMTMPNDLQVQTRVLSRGFVELRFRKP